MTLPEGRKPLSDLWFTLKVNNNAITLPHTVNTLKITRNGLKVKEYDEVSCIHISIKDNKLTINLNSWNEAEGND